MKKVYFITVRKKINNTYVESEYMTFSKIKKYITVFCRDASDPVWFENSEIENLKNAKNTIYLFSKNYSFEVKNFDLYK